MASYIAVLAVQRTLSWNVLFVRRLGPPHRVSLDSAVLHRGYGRRTAWQLQQDGFVHEAMVTLYETGVSR